MNGHNKIQAGKNGRESVDKNPQPCFHYGGIAESRAEWRVEGPAGIQAAGQHRVQHENAAGNIAVPAQQIDFREGQIPCPNHQWDQKISQHSRHGGNQEEEDHDHAMHGEQLVIGIGLNQITGRSQQFQPDEQGKKSSNKEKERNRGEVQQGDTLVIGGEQPRTYAVLFIQIMLAFSGYRNCGCHAIPSAPAAACREK